MYHCDAPSTDEARTNASLVSNVNMNFERPVLSTDCRHAGNLSAHLTIPVVLSVSSLRYDCPFGCRLVYCPYGLRQNFPFRRLVVPRSHRSRVPIAPRPSRSCRYLLPSALTMCRRLGVSCRRGARPRNQPRLDKVAILSAFLSRRLTSAAMLMRLMRCLF